MSNKKFAILAPLLISILIYGCSNVSDNIVSELQQSDKEAIKQLLENNDFIASTELSLNDNTYLPPNFDMDEISKEIYPLKWGRIIKKVTREYEYEQINDTLVVVTIIRSIESNFLIAASFTKGSRELDTVVVKPLSESYYRKVKVVKTSTGRWRIHSISLVQGGTGNDNMKIKKIEMTFPNGNTVEITDPLNQFFRPGFFFRHRRDFVPVFRPFARVNLKVTIETSAPDTNFVGVTYGVNRFRRHRIRRALHLVSSDGNVKVYEGTIRVHLHRGAFNAFVHAVTKESLFDDSAPISISVWGVPYIVN
jgi:hypothetical protein